MMRKRIVAVPVIGIVIGLLVIVAGWMVRRAGAGPGGWSAFMLGIRDEGESYLPAAAYENPDFILNAARMSSTSLLVAGALCILTALLFWAARSFRAAAWLLMVAVVAEHVVFGRKSLDQFELAFYHFTEAREFLQERPGDYRILDLRDRNVALRIGAKDIWGYNPGVLRRYSELVGATQGVPPERATQYINFTRDHPVLDLLRCKFIFLPQNNDIIVRERTNSLPQLLLVTHHRVLTNSSEVLTAVTNDAFDPRQEIILEAPPEPAPLASDNPGSVRLVNASTDHLTIEADIRSPAILLVTDNYARGWRARAVSGNVRNVYAVMPANYCLRGIPLSAGKHLIRLEYEPLSFRLGKWVSLVSLAVFLILAARVFARRLASDRKRSIR
jgi:hypothetical protein